MIMALLNFLADVHVYLLNNQILTQSCHVNEPFHSLGVVSLRQETKRLTLTRIKSMKSFFELKGLDYEHRSLEFPSKVCVD